MGFGGLEFGCWRVCSSAGPCCGQGLSCGTTPRRRVRETPRSHLRGIVLMAALLLLTGLGIGGWALLARSEREEVARPLTGGDPSRAPALMTRYGCGGCHAIPGVPGADGRVAAPLTGMRERVYVGGVVRNTPQGMMSWIVDPRVLSPRTAMPVTGITATEARDVAAYLYAH